MKTTFIENLKKGIFSKKALIVGGVLTGLYLIGAAMSADQEVDLEIEPEVTDSEEVIEAEVISEEKIIDLEEKR